MTPRESKAINKRMSIRAAFVDKNVHSSMMSARDEITNDSGNTRRSSIVVSPTAKFATPYQAERRTNIRPHIG